MSDKQNVRLKRSAGKTNSFHHRSFSVYSAVHVFIRHSLRDLVVVVQFKKLEKHLRWSATFSKVGLFMKCGTGLKWVKDSTS